MAKRVKPILNIPTVSSLEEADAMLARIAARKRELSLLELGLKEDVDALLEGLEAGVRMLRR